ncbi:hypothetical protein [Nocardia sp. NPDC049707]|uniref:hypothetical protein n=1 Tax=Nocardia sp. NPDC049707 TaxID=3154735 RepID=UPI00344A92EB
MPGQIFGAIRSYRPGWQSVGGFVWQSNSSSPDVSDQLVECLDVAGQYVRIMFAVLGIISAQGVEQVSPGQPIHHFGVRRTSGWSAGLDCDVLRMSFGFVVDQFGQNRQLFLDDVRNIAAVFVDHALDADVLMGAAQHDCRRFFCPGEDPQEETGIVQRLIGSGLDGWR